MKKIIAEVLKALGLAEDYSDSSTPLKELAIFDDAPAGALGLSGPVIRDLRKINTLDEANAVYDRHSHEALKDFHDKAISAIAVGAKHGFFDRANAWVELHNSVCRYMHAKFGEQEEEESQGDIPDYQFGAHLPSRQNPLMN